MKIFYITACYEVIHFSTKEFWKEDNRLLLFYLSTDQLKEF